MRVAMSWNDNLEGEALEVARSQSKRLRVMAGPGTGKSYAMKKRIMRLIEDEQVKPDKILAVTFTRTAASDLKKELQLGIAGAEKIHAMTLHSFCFGLLNQKDVFDKLQRIPRPLKTFNSKGSPQFELSPLLADLDLVQNFGNKRAKFKIIKAFEAAWARTQNENLWLKDEQDRLFHNEMERWLKIHDSMLIGELVPLALRYLQDNPASDIFDKYLHIIVDEYQDLNKAEQTLIDLLGEKSSISVVGDIYQSPLKMRNLLH
jgi:DNA helicase II / ATP-dependent DNA helicase PcrA